MNLLAYRPDGTLALIQHDDGDTYLYGLWGDGCAYERVGLDFTVSGWETDDPAVCANMDEVRAHIAAGLEVRP